MVSHADYMKQARVHLDLLHEKQPENPKSLRPGQTTLPLRTTVGAALQEMQKQSPPTQPIGVVT